MYTDGKSATLKVVVIGTSASLVCAFLLGLMVTPTAVQMQKEGSSGVLPVPVPAYWFNVMGMTVWLTILGGHLSVLIAVVMMWWKRGKG